MSTAFPDASTVIDGDVMSGAVRHPRQMLADQEYDGHASVHDEAVAGDLGLTGAPIEGPTHFSQFDPLAYELWGEQWFTTGRISAHFQTMVVEGESVSATARQAGDDIARIDAAKPDGTPVLTGTVSVGAGVTTELGERVAKTQARDPGELFIVDQLSVGDRVADPTPVSMDHDTPNGNLYPFSLRQKLDAITEPSPWYSSADNPWGRAVIPIEMISVLSSKGRGGFPVRGPAVGLFVDLEVGLVNGPLFVDEEYLLEREVVALGQSRRVELYWVLTTITRAATGEPAADVLLHSGTFKASYADYPQDRLEQ